MNLELKDDLGFDMLYTVLCVSHIFFKEIAHACLSNKSIRISCSKCVPGTDDIHNHPCKKITYILRYFVLLNTLFWFGRGWRQIY